MKILIAPNAFKESLSASQAASSIARGLQRALPSARLDLLPLSDGGPGLLDALRLAVGPGAKLHTCRVFGPLGPGTPRVKAAWLSLPGKRAVIESAQCVGLERVPKKQKAALRATSFGLGQLLLKAAASGCRDILLGLGGSATTDGGCGMAQALGYKFLDAPGRPLELGGAALARLERIVPPARDPLVGIRIRALCDVRNPLTGPQGAARVFSPQKGASPAQVNILEHGLQRLGALLGRRRALVPGAGAAGGLGAGVLAFLHGRLVPGSREMLAFTGFHRRLKGCSWAVSGEGRLDSQSFLGKLPWVICRAAKKEGIPCLLVCGTLTGSRQAWKKSGATQVLEIHKSGRPLKYSMTHARGLIEFETEKFFGKQV